MTPPPTTTSTPPHPIPTLLPLLLLPQIPHPLHTSPTPPNLAIENQSLRATRPLPLSHLILPMIICAIDVETMDVGRNDAAEEEDAVEEGVGVGACEEEDGERWEN